MNLEEFSYQFGVNGAENLIAKLNQIETETEDLDNAVQHLGNTFQQLFDLSLRSAIPPAFIKMVMDQAMAFSRQAEYIDRLSQTSGIATKTIQQFGYALHRFGGDVSTATAQLDRLQTQFERFKKPISKGGGLASELAKIAKLHKVDLRGVTDSVDLLKAISVRMEKLSERKKLDLAKAFGLDDSTFLMVKNGLKSLEESLYKAQKFVLFDDKEIKQAKEFENTLRDIADNITLISKSFSFGAIPEMQKFANVMRKVTDFMTEHNKVVKGIGLTAFSAGAYGIFRLLNFLPTKFLKASAGVFGGGLALGSISEEVDKLDNKQRDKTYIGRLERLGYKETAKYLELIYRAINDLSFNKSFDGLKNLLNKIGKDLGIKSLEKENIDKSLDNTNSIFEEYKDALKKYGLTGLVARAMTSGDTVEKRIENFTQNRKVIEEQGGALSFLWKKLETIFSEIKNTLTNKDFWTPIFDKINSMLDYLKGIFYDLVIFVKQQAGIELSSSDKAHLLKKQLQSDEQESIDKVIKSASGEITDIMTSDADLGVKKDKIQQRVSELSSQISNAYGNSGYSKENITARLLFEGSTKAFKQQNPEWIKNIESLTSYLQDLGLQALASKDQISKLYEEYKTKNQQKIANSAESLKTTIDISDIIGDKKIDNVDVKNISLQDFINKAFPLLSQDQTGKALARYKSVMPEDSLLSALTFTEQKPSLEEFMKSIKGTDGKGTEGQTGGFFSRIIDWIGNLQPVADNLQPLIVSRLKYHQKRLKKIKEIDPENTDIDYNLLQKDIEKLSFTELIKEEINAELNDIYRNYISIDLAIERIGTLIDESATLISDINKGIAKIKEKITDYIEKFSQYAGMIIGASLGSIAGPKGTIIGGLAGLLIGDKLFKGRDKNDYSWVDYGKEKLVDAKDSIKELYNKVTSSGNPQRDNLNNLNSELASLKVQLGEADTDVLTDALFDLIKKKEEEIAKAQAILEGSKNIETIGNSVAANSNSPAVNNNSQNNVVNINQNINVGKINASSEDIAREALDATRNGVNQGIRDATNNRAMGNIN